MVATVNGEPILVSDLEYSLNFFPQYAPSKKGPEAARAYLDLLIEKRLFAQEGRNHGFASSENVRKVADWILREEMLKELYSREIRDKVTVTDQEVQEQFLKGLESYRVRHIFVPTEDQAWEVKKRLDNGLSFEAIAGHTFQDSLLRKNGGDLGFLTLDQMVPEFAEIVPNLKEGQISDPVRSRWGYHIIRVDNRRRVVFADKSTLESNRTRLERTLRMTKEKQRGKEFVASYMKPFEVKLINSSFSTLGDELKKIIIAATGQVPRYQPVLGGRELELMTGGLESYYNLPLVTFKGGEWTIGEFMDKVRSLPLTQRPSLETPAKFRRDIGKLVRDEFMVAEARRRGYDKLKRVQKEVAKWRDDFTFSEFWNSVRDTIQVSDAEVTGFFQQHQGRYLMPERVHMQEILLATEKEADAVLSKIRAGKDFGALARQHSLRQWAAKEEGDLGWLKRGDYGNTSTKGFEMSDGQIAGPFPVREGFVVIRRLGYAPERPMSFQEAAAIVAEDARKEKQMNLYAGLKQKLLAEANISINEQLLEEVGKAHNKGNLAMPGLREASAN